MVPVRIGLSLSWEVTRLQEEKEKKIFCLSLSAAMKTISLMMVADASLGTRTVSALVSPDRGEDQSGTEESPSSVDRSDRAWSSCGSR